MKKVLLVFLVAVLMVVTPCLSLAAREESDVILLHGCDKAFGGFNVDRSEQTEGAASLKIRLSGESFVAQTKLPYEIDIEYCNTVAVDIYVEDATKLAGVESAFLEISSSGECDKNELQWEFAGQWKESAESDEWVTIYLDIPAANNSGIDLTEVNFVRFYLFYGKDATGMQLYVDNIRACHTDGEDFSDMELDAYQKDNPDVDVKIAGQDAPDPEEWAAAITPTWGIKK